MTVFKLIAKLLKFKDFRCNGLAFRRGNRLDVLVKPHKNGCRCPHCGRRGTSAASFVSSKISIQLPQWS